MHIYEKSYDLLFHDNSFTPSSHEPEINRINVPNVTIRIENYSFKMIIHKIMAKSCVPLHVITINSYFV